MSYKLRVLIPFILFSCFIHSQSISVKTGENIARDKLKIHFSQGTWNLKIFNLFDEGEVVKNNFPEKEGIYNLTISYDNNYSYNESVLYIQNPKYEHISFSFYKENQRVFCKIKSEHNYILNKEVVISKMNTELKEVLDEVNKKN